MATGAMRAIDVTAGSSETMLNQLIVGLHIHIDMRIRKSAYGVPVIQVATRLSYRCEKYQFSMIVHYQMTISLEYILSKKSLDGKSAYVEKYCVNGFK